MKLALSVVKFTACIMCMHSPQGDEITIVCSQCVNVSNSIA